jgi:hypothetical protein
VEAFRRAGLTCEPKTLRRWEAAVQQLERAEGIPTPSIPHDSSAFQQVYYAERRLRQALERDAIARVMVKAFRRAVTEGHRGEALKVAADRALLSDPALWKAAAELRLLAVERYAAITRATDSPPRLPCGDPYRHVSAANAYLDQVNRLQVSGMGLDAATVGRIVANPRADELVRLVREQLRESRQDRAWRRDMPGA